MRDDELLDRLDGHMDDADSGLIIAIPDDVAGEVRDRYLQAEAFLASHSKANAVYADFLRASFPAASRSVTHGVNVLVVSVLAVILVAIGAGKIAGWSFWIITLALLYSTDRRNRKKNRLRRTLDDGRCPSCRHDTRGVKSIDDERLRDLDLGPARCPECGYRWPRIPSRMVGGTNASAT